MNNFNSNIPNLVMLVQPDHFGFNPETANSNHFQNKVNLSSVEVKRKVKHEFDGVLAAFDTHEIAYKTFEVGEEVLPDAVFPNNWIAVLPNRTLGLFPMYTPNRRAEVRADIINWVKEVAAVQQEINLLEKAKEGLILEGTGSMVFDHAAKKAYACESDRTSIPLFEAFCRQTGYQPISFESVDLNGKQIYHTNVMMAIGDKYALINLDSIPNQLEQSFCRLSLEKSGKEVITLTYPQMNAFAANALEVQNKRGDTFLIMSLTAFNVLSEEQKDKISAYATLLPVDVSTIEKIGGGSIRCMLAGLFTNP